LHFAGERYELKCPVIFTTAYDEYAIKAFISIEVCYHSLNQTARSLNINCFLPTIAVILIIDFKEQSNDHPVTHHTNNKIKKGEIRATNKMAEISRR